MGEFTLKNYFVPDKNPFIDLLVGFLAGVLFIYANSINPAITIGIPTVFFSTVAERWATVVFLFPILEELFFRMLLPFALLTLAARFAPKIPVLGQVLALLIIPPIFSIYHATAYAGSLSAQNIQTTAGLFLGAWLFGLITVGLVLWRKNVLSPTVMHIMVNAYLLSQKFVIVA